MTESRKASKKAACKSEGHRLLCELGKTSAAIGREVGASRATVSAWRTGRKTPGLKMRRSLEAIGVPASSWALRPSEAPASMPKGPGMKEGSNLEQIEALIRDMQTIRRIDLEPVAAAKVSAELRLLLSARERLLAMDIEGTRLDILEDIVVRESTRFRRFVEAILAVAKSHPEAGQALRQAVEDMEGAHA